MEHYVNAPALFYADEIRVQSEEMKQGYIRKLIEVVQRKLDAKEEWAEGFENLLEDDIRAIFENKIHVMPELKEVNYWHYKKESSNFFRILIDTRMKMVTGRKQSTTI